MPPFHLRKHRWQIAVLSTYLLPLISLDYGTWGVLQAKGNTTVHPKIGQSEANNFATAGCQNEAIVRQHCYGLSLCLEKCVAIGSAYSY
jgi:hypothetical protein